MIIGYFHSETNFWVSLVVLFVIGLGYIISKLTGGLTTGYLKENIGTELKNTLILIQGLGSLLISLFVPNNYLIDFEFFKQLYDKNDLWIAVSVLALLVLFITLFGTLFTLMARRHLRKIAEKP